MNAPDNPLAFPSPMIPEWSEGATGMTLRDWFAGQAMCGLLASPIDGPAGRIDEHAKHFSFVAFAYADAMLAARRPDLLTGVAK